MLWHIVVVDEYAAPKKNGGCAYACHDRRFFTTMYVQSKSVSPHVVMVSSESHGELIFGVEVSPLQALMH